MKNNIAFLLASTILSVPGLAVAQEASPTTQAASTGELGDIVVTARRREENIQSVPVAVTALSGETLRKLGAVTVQDVSRMAPSVTIGTGSRGASVPFLSIRGISSSDLTGAIDPSIGIYLNDVIMNRPNGILSTLYDLQSVQVLRGPQGTLFGRNTVGGAILLSTRRPTEELGGYVRASVGNYDLKSAEGVLNLPLAEWAGLRVAGKIARRDGFVTSLATGQKQSDIHDEGFRATLTLKPTPDIESTTIGSYYHSDTNGTGGTTPGLMPIGAQTAGRIIINANGNVSDPGNRAAIVLAGQVSAANFYHTMSNELQFDRVKSYDLSNTTTIQLSDVLALKNIIAYRRVDTHNLFDNDAANAKQVVVYTTNRFRQFTEELQLSADLGRLNLLTGVYYFKEWGRDFTAGGVGIPLTQLVQQAARSYTGGYIRNSSISGFVNASIEITDKLKVNAGGRYTWDKRFMNLDTHSVSWPDGRPASSTDTGPIGASTCLLGTLVSVVPGAGPNGADVYTIQPANPCSLQRTAKFNDPTYSIDISWQATPDVMLYAAHRHGYHSGAFNIRAVFNVDQDVAKPEYLDDVEIGLKSQFHLGGMPMRFNAAAYYGWYKDIQRSVSLPAQLLITLPNPVGILRSPTGIGNAARAHIAGVELEYQATLFDGFSLNAYAAYNQTKYDEFIDRTFNPPYDRTNDLFAHAPKFTAGATARYEFPIGTDGTSGVFQVNYFHTDSFNDSLAQQPVYTVLPGYDLINLRAEVNNVAGSGIDLAAFVNNLTKKKYFTGGSTVGSLGASVQTPGAPRMFGFEATWRFGGER